MKSIITALLLSTSLIVSAQVNMDNLLGKWEYQEIYKKEKLDSSQVAMLTELFSSMSLQFDQDGLFRAIIMGNSEEGRWVSEKKNTITLTSNNGNIHELHIVELTDDQFTFKFRENTLVMNKLPEGESMLIVDPLVTFTPVAATKEQIAKKWHLESRESFSDKSEEIKEAAEALMEGAYLELKKNGKFEIFILGVKEKGKWELGENETSIITTSAEGKKVWNIVGITDSEIVLVKGNSQEKWFFLAEE